MLIDTYVIADKASAKSGISESGYIWCVLNTVCLQPVARNACFHTKSPNCSCQNDITTTIITLWNIFHRPIQMWQHPKHFWFSLSAIVSALKPEILINYFRTNWIPLDSYNTLLMPKLRLRNIWVQKASLSNLITARRTIEWRNFNEGQIAHRCSIM